MKNLTNLIKQPRIFWITVVQTLFCFNDSLFKNAFIILLTYKALRIVSLQPESLIAIGAALFILPLLIFSPFCAQLAAKYPKPKVIQYCKLFEIATASVALLAFITVSVPLMYIVLLMLGMQSALFVTTKLSMVPEIAASDEFVAVNGLFDTGLFVSSIAGTFIGGLLILLPQGPIIITVLMLSLSIIAYGLSLKIPPLVATNPERTIQWHPIKKMHLLINSVKHNHLAITAMLGIAWFWFMATLFLMQTAAFVKTQLHMYSDVATFYIALFSIGIAIGAILCEKIRSASIEFRTTTWGAIGMSIFIVLLVITPTTSTVKMEFFARFNYLNNNLSMLWVLLIGVAGGFYMVPLYALLHHASGKQDCENIFSLTNVVYSVFVIISALLTTLLIQAGWQIKNVFILAAVLNLGFNAVLFIREPRFIKTLGKGAS